MKSFFKYLGIGTLSMVLGCVLFGSGVLAFAVFFGAPSLIINALILTYYEKTRNKQFST